MFLQGSSLCDGQPAGVQPLPSKTVPNVAPIHYWESVWCAWALAFGGSKISCLETTLTSKCQTLHRNMSKQKWIHRLLMFFLSSKYQNIFEALIVVPRDQLTVEAGLSKNKARYLSEEIPNWTSSWKSWLMQIFWRSQRETHDFSFGVWLVPKRAEQAPSRTARQDALLNLAQRFHKFSNSDKMNRCWENVMSTPLRSAFAHITSYIIYNILQYVI